MIICEKGIVIMLKFNYEERCVCVHIGLYTHVSLQYFGMDRIYGSVFISNNVHRINLAFTVSQTRKLKCRKEKVLLLDVI